MTIDSLPNLADGSVIVTACAGSDDPESRGRQFYWQLSNDESAIHLYPKSVPLTGADDREPGHGLVFAYVPFEGDLDQETLAERAEQRALARKRQNPELPTVPSVAASEAVLPEPIDARAAALWARWSNAQIVTPIRVSSSTAEAPDPDLYPADRLIDGSGLSAPLRRVADLPTSTHALADDSNAWCSDDNIPDYFSGPGALPVPVLTFGLAEPTEISAFVFWPYRFAEDNPATGNQPSAMRFTFFDHDGEPIGEQQVVRLELPVARGARILELAAVPAVKTIKLELLDNYLEQFPGGDRVALAEVRFLSSGSNSTR